MKLNIKSGLIVLALFTLTACSVSKEQIQQERQLNQALRKVNQADREVTTRENAVKVAGAALAAENVALAKAKQDQKNARANFESLYGMAPPAPAPVSGQ